MDQETTIDRAPHAAGDRPRRRPGRPPAGAPIAEVETRALILSHARRLFMQRGFASVSVGEVAEAVGVSKPTLYYHFGDKEGLYAAVLIDALTEVGGYIRHVVQSRGSVRERLTQLAHGYFMNADATMEPMLRDTNELLGSERATSVHAAYDREMIEPIADLMRDGMRTGELAMSDPRTLVRAYMGLLDAFTEPGGRAARSPDEHLCVSRQIVALFVDGAGAPGTTV